MAAAERHSSSMTPGAVSGPKHAGRLSRLSEPVVLFSLLGVFVLATIWGLTWFIVTTEHRSAREAAEAAALDVARVYEAQTFRALREIDQVLKVVQYAWINDRQGLLLETLSEHSLMPPAFLFTVSLTDSSGHVVQSTRSALLGAQLQPDQPLTTHDMDELKISQSLRSVESGEWTLSFSRPLPATEQATPGRVVLSVDPAYFVSGYEISSLGEHGLLGLIGDDGVFRVRRSGEQISHDEAVDYEALQTALEESSERAVLMTSPLDGVLRYQVKGELFGFPLAVMVGLAKHEQLAFAEQQRLRRVMLAFLASLIALAVVLMLGRSSQRLQESRQRILDEQIAHARKVEYLAFHDGLTGLPNRSLFSRELERLVAQAAGNHQRLAVLFLDLDRFKIINDTLGHAAGDELLIEVSRRLRANLRESDLVARLGGDEFVVILPEQNSDEELAVVARKLLNAVKRPFVLKGHELRITVSIGISRYPEDGNDEETLTRHADAAMYNAKSEGKNNFRLYSSELDTSSLERLALESDLRRALDQNEFELHFQARQNMKSGQITGVEALLRWHHPQLGLIEPRRFLPLAQDMGVAVKIGHWVLESACRQAAQWSADGVTYGCISVNLSDREVHDERLPELLRDLLARFDIQPGQIELEVSEALLMKDMGSSLPLLAQLKAMGVRVAVDNFGVGYSPLSAFHSFQIDTVKVDGVYIRNLVDNPGDQRLVEAVIAMARAVGLTVVAEGVETSEQALLLGSQACDEIQGYYFARPQSADQVTQLLRSQKTKVSPG